MRELFYLLSLFILPACIHRAPAPFVTITILHTNDVHGHAWPERQSDGSLRGGFAAQAQVIERIRDHAQKKGDIVLVLSGGDVNTGVPESDLLKAEPDFTAMNLIGYDAMALGNHELDGGVGRLEQQMHWAKFPILSSNVISKESGKPLAIPSVILIKNGIKIGIVGFTTETLMNISLPKHVAGLEVRNVFETGENQIRKLKRQGAEIILAVSHVGLSNSGNRARLGIERDEVTISRRFPELAAVIGGHTHTLLMHGISVGGRYVVQAGEKGLYLGRLDIVWNLDQHEAASESATVILRISVKPSSEIGLMPSTPFGAKRREPSVIYQTARSGSMPPSPS